MNHTILAWNNKRILVEYVSCLPSLSSNEEDIEIETTLERMQKSLSHKKGDPRWQILPGYAVVTKLPPVERKQR